MQSVPKSCIVKNKLIDIHLQGHMRGVFRICKLLLSRSSKIQYQFALLAIAQVHQQWSLSLDSTLEGTACLPTMNRFEIRIRSCPLNSLTNCKQVQISYRNNFSVHQ